MKSLRRLLLFCVFPASWPAVASPAQLAPAAVPRFDRFQELPINRIAPAGWVREFLQRQVTGLTGHRTILAYPYDTCLWAGEIPRQGEQGDDWWRYEQTAYLTDGIIRLGYLLDDPELIATGRAGVDYILQHPMANGRLGHPFFASQWPMAVFFHVMQAEYSAHRDPALLAALATHYRSYTVDELARGLRHVVNIEGMLWTYGLTGDRALLEKAEAIYLAGGGKLPLADAASDRLVRMHGVTYAEEAKLPAILYSYTGNPRYRDAAVNAFRKLERDHLLPDGVPSSNEFLSGKDPLTSHETCDISDYTWSLGHLLMATGEAGWADRIEQAIFNAGPGAVSKDFRNFQYFSSVNQVIATGTSNHNNGSVPHAYGSTWMAYWPCNEVECCAGNVHRFMPNYAARQWLTDRQGGLVAALYGPSRVTCPAPADGTPVTVVQDTRYPFAETITFRFATGRPAALPFTFRIPVWCDRATAQVNGTPLDRALTPGTFVTLDRVFQDGDTITLHLPMTARLVDHGHWGVGVERGPLVYAFPVPEQVSVDDHVYPNLNGKRSADPVNFPALDLRPAGDWNYALAAQSAADLSVLATTGDGYPFDPAGTGPRIRVPVRKIRNWKLADDRFTPRLPSAASYTCAPEVEYVDLVPYGSTRLRLTVFPRSE